MGNNCTRSRLGDTSIASNGKIIFGLDVSKRQSAILDTPNRSGLRCKAYRTPVIQDADRIILVINNTAHDAGFGVRQELQFLSSVDVGSGNIRVGLAHQEALFAGERNRVFRKHGSQAEIIIVVHVFDEHILVSSRLGHIPGQGNSERLVRRADALRASGDDQVLARDIGIIYGLCVVDSQFRMQTHVALLIVLRGVYRAYVDGGMIPFRVLAASYRDIAACLYVQRAFFHSVASLIRFFLQEDAQRHIALDREGQQIAVFIAIGSDVGSAHLHELLHVFNSVVACQIFHFNRGGLV